MKKSDFKKLLARKIVLLDGAWGTELQKRGMPAGISPEKWVLENPSVLIELQQEYVRAGSDMVYTCTFGCNYYKLKDFGLEKEVRDMNKKLARISRKAVGEKCLVVGDMGSTGKLIKPFGDTDFELAVDAYKEQVRGLVAGGVDLFVIETMMDIQEARSALLAIKETCDLPVLVSMTYEKGGRTLTGSDPMACLIALQSLGADAVGVNCSTGPEDMLLVLSAMRPYALVPLFAKPNAGLPELVNGQSVFRMSPEEFASYAPDLVKAGATLLGGCCGTSPEHIRLMSLKIKKAKPVKPLIPSLSALSSARRSLVFGKGEPLVIIGERINPTGKKLLQEELSRSEFNEVRRLAREQEEQGARVLDVNCGLPGADEKELMKKVTDFLVRSTDLPLCFDSSDVGTLEAALRIYPGRALVNSISLEKKKINKLLPVAAKYGAMFILLPMDDENIPDKAEQRIRIIQQVFQKAKRWGYTKDDIIADGLAMAVSSDPGAALETLKVIEWCDRKFGMRTIVGLSNISFGLPERGIINASFLILAFSRGLSMAIANPGHELLLLVKAGADLLLKRDRDGKNYLAFFSKVRKNDLSQIKEKIRVQDPGALVLQAVVEGDKDNIVPLVKTSLDSGIQANEIVNRFLIPGIQKVGDLFDRKEYFLPQLIMSAEAMRKAFDFLAPMLKKEERSLKDKTIILATVKGDIHDIGKNIVGLMLKNYGFNVIDLGKNVEAEVIIRKAIETKAEIIGLSALMTTTMTEMRKVINLGRKKGLKADFIIGGAVVTDKYAQEIGALFARDAMEAVRVVEKIK